MGKNPRQLNGSNYLEKLGESLNTLRTYCTEHNLANHLILANEAEALQMEAEHKQGKGDAQLRNDGVRSTIHALTHFQQNTRSHTARELCGKVLKDIGELVRLHLVEDMTPKTMAKVMNR